MIPAQFTLRRFALALAVVLPALLAQQAYPTLAKEAPVYSESANIAINGFDPVAYFVAGKPVQGDSKVSTSFNGATWVFASEANRALFVANPAKYAPQFGGYCSWAVSQGYTASTDPNAWKIVDGKLYLNYSLEIAEKWKMDIPGNIAKANANWPKVLDK